MFAFITFFNYGKKYLYALKTLFIKPSRGELDIAVTF